MPTVHRKEMPLPAVGQSPPNRQSTASTAVLWSAFASHPCEPTDPTTHQIASTESAAPRAPPQPPAPSARSTGKPVPDSIPSDQSILVLSIVAPDAPTVSSPTANFSAGTNPEEATSTGIAGLRVVA